MSFKLFPLFGSSTDSPLPLGDDVDCAMALLDAPELAVAMQKIPEPSIELDAPTPEPGLDPNPTPTFGLRR